MYPDKNLVERQQIEHVFGLTGGELATEPLRYLVMKIEDGWCTVNKEKNTGHWAKRVILDRRWARYLYDGVPDYARPELRRRVEVDACITIVTCEVFGEMPRKIWTHGRAWVKVARYGSSGECECPMHGQQVMREEIGEEVEVCPMCGAKIGEEHGYIYVGEGWAEVVYAPKGS